MKGLVDVVWVGLGGFVGSSLRYMVSGWVHRIPGTAGFPYGTLVVNVAGCLVLGLVGGWAEHRQLFSPATRLFFMIGVLGGFTTFSTFAYESLTLANGSDFARASINILVQLALGLGAVWLGFSAAKIV